MDLVWFRPAETEKTILINKNDAIFQIVRDYDIEYYYAKFFLERTHHGSPLICKSGIYKYTPHWNYLSIDDIINYHNKFGYLFANGEKFNTSLIFRLKD